MEVTASGTSTDASLLERVREARSLSDEIFAIVRPEAFYDRPIPERHRIVFYLGHLEAFDWNLLNGRLFEVPSVSPAFDKLFAFGIDPVDGGLPSDQPGDWPARDQIEAYKRRVREILDTRLAAVWDDSPERQREAAQLLHVAIEHRLMHVETLSYMLHQLPIDRKYRRESPPGPEAEPYTGPAHSIKIPKGNATLGMRRTEDGPFGWDNEFEEHSVFVPAFLIDERKVTNGEFLRFMKAGGYQERSFWSDDDWNWITSSGKTHPSFWFRRGDKRWHPRTMFDEVPLPADWPVYVSHAEASAYANWAGLDLPTEEEFHRAAYATPQGIERSYPWGEQPPDPSRGNFDFQRWDPVATGAYQAGKSAYGVYDLLGNGWEWTRTVFAPFEGFQPFPCYPGYSANFFDGKHYVLKGGSARTARCMLRRSFRNWFQPHYPYIFSGFRCVEH